MKKLSLFLAPALLLLSPLVFSTTAVANEPKLVSKHGNWATYSRHDGDNKICYALSEPQNKSPKSVRHGDIYFMVANWKSGAALEQPSFLAGYNLKTTSPPKARIGSSNYRMYVSQNEAFIEDGSDEKALVKNMRAGSSMRVEAVSQRGTAVTYSFSLSGVTAALNAARSACR